MAVDDRDPVTGALIFLDTGAPDTGVDPSEVSKQANDVGTRIIRPSLAQLEAYPYARKGLGGYAEDTDTEYTHDGFSWVQTGAGAPVVITPATSLWDFDWTGFLPGAVAISGQRVFMQGIVSNASTVSAVSANTAYRVGTIPAAFTPSATAVFVSHAAGNGQAIVRVLSNGDVTVTPLFNGGPYAPGVFTVWLDGCNWPVK